MSEKVYIVTGANGFLGNVIVKKLSTTQNVRCLILPNSDREPLHGVNCAIYEGDVTKIETLNELFDVKEGMEIIVIHCAAIVSIKSKYDDTVRKVNVEGVKNIVEQCLRHHAKLIYVSSVHAITEKPDQELMRETKEFDPDSVYGLYAKTKAEASRYVMQAIQEKGLQACILHPSGIIGPGDYGQTHLTRLIEVFLSGKLSLCVKGGYNFVDVRDVADGVIQASLVGKVGETYILANRYASIQEILDMVAKYKTMPKVKIIPFFLAKLGAPFMELYYDLKKETPLYTRYSLYTVKANGSFDHTKATRELGFKPRNLKETIEDTVDWIERREMR